MAVLCKTWVEGDYLYGMDMDEYGCFVCTDIIKNIIDRHLESIGSNQGLLVHLIDRYHQKN